MNSDFIHIIDTSPFISLYKRGSVTSNIQLFDVEEFNFSKNLLIQEIAPSFHELPFDYYDVARKIENIIEDANELLFKKHEQDWINEWNRIGGFAIDIDEIRKFWPRKISSYEDEVLNLKPHRRRSCFKYSVRKIKKNYWKISELGSPVFKQNVKDVRSRVRKFAPPPIEIYRNRGILNLIGVLAELVSMNLNAHKNNFYFTMHQMITYTNESKKKGSAPAPEGIHQDGSPFIVSALVVERSNVSGGESKVFYDNGHVIAMQHTLMPGEGIFQSDMLNGYYHSISPIYSLNNELGYRSIIGFDIDFK